MKGKGNKSKKAQNTKAIVSLGTVVNPRNESRFFRNEATGRPASLRRRLTRVGAVTATSGLNFAYAESSGNVVNALEWSNLSLVYQQYRVRAIKVRIVPRNFNNMGFAATVWFPGVIVAARYPSGSSASTIYAAFAEGGSQIFDCQNQHPTRMATMADNPDAALFTDCNVGAPAALSQYGVQFVGTVDAPAIYNGVVTHDTFTEWDVEFLARN